MRAKRIRTAAVEHHRSTPIEHRTLCLAAVIYGGWIAVTLLHRRIPPPLLFLLGGWLMAWQGSFQHETIHGHPTPWPRVNAILGGAPLSLWLPYACYRKSHLAHHASEDLTAPGADPESRYLEDASGKGGAIRRMLAICTSTLLGRLILGPLLEIGQFLCAEAAGLLRGDRERRSIWIGHLMQVAVVVAWLKLVCGMSLVVYALAFIYPGAALALLRSFAEHRAAPDPAHRIAVVERAPILGLLFLNNNLHAVHHQRPGASWWELPQLYRQQRAAILSDNGGLVYDGYAEVFRRYALSPHDRVTHPSRPSVGAKAAA